MINRGVCRKIDRVKIPENRRLRDGPYRARKVALEYSQIPGIDNLDNFAPVAHDVSFRIALARMMVENLDSLVMDVETAFLYGDIEEEILMKSPVGMEEIDPGSSTEDCEPAEKGDLWTVSSSKTILEKICGHNKERTLWLHSESSRSMYGVQRKQPWNVHNHHVLC